MVMPGKRRRPRWLAVPFLCLLAAPAPVAGQEEIDFWDSPFVSFQAADIDQRVQQLASEKLPRNAELLVKQHEAISRLIGRLQTVAKAKTPDPADLNTFAVDLDRHVAALSVVDCAVATDSKLRELADAQARIAMAYNELPETREPPPALRHSVSSREDCATARSAVTAAAPGIRAEIKKLLEARQRRAVNLQKAREAADKGLVILQKKKEEVGAALDSLQTAAVRSDYRQWLWAIILVVGGLSLGAIYIVRSFKEELQFEWIVSGQVIQFVTVMILLSVVLALGLSEILKETTLGTLLGGIAGHVLSQGVGRPSEDTLEQRRAAVRQRAAVEPPPTPVPAG